MNSAFEISEPRQLIPGVQMVDLVFPAGPAKGRAALIDVDAVQLNIYVFYELVNKSFNERWGFAPKPHINMGINIPQFLRRERPESRRVASSEVEGLVLACNTTHTNFVRGNGFVVVDGELVYKPPGSVALDGREYRPLNGGYTALVLSPGLPRVTEVIIVKNCLVYPDGIRLAISGPPIVECGKNVTSLVSVRKRELGQTMRNEINYATTERTSFTAFGVRQDGQLVCLSMFGGYKSECVEEYNCQFFSKEKDRGISLMETAELLILLGVVDGIAGGGAGDTQQYIMGGGTWAGQPRVQACRPQVGDDSDDPIQRLRGLGAVLGVAKAT